MTYTLSDVEFLAQKIATHNLPYPEYVQDTIDIWMNTLEGVKKECEDINEMILQLMGPYFTGFNREISKQEGMTDLIFNMPLDEMPLYISSEIEWQAVISLWRLAIDK